MLKKVTIHQLRVGMYINSFYCSWFKHPFLLNKFLLKDVKEINKIRTASIKFIEIDINKGVDAISEKKSIDKKLSKNNYKKNLSKPNTNNIQVEMKAAKIAYNEAETYITDMMATTKMGAHVELEQLNPVINKLSSSILRNPNALLGLSRIRTMDKYTFEHSVSFSVLMMSFAKSIGKDDEFIRLVGIGGLLHDIGKTLTPDHILNKPEKLTADEFEIMKEHVVHSRVILEKTEGLSKVSMDVAVMHHEKFDGNGYPKGLKGDEISLSGQMSSIVDVYDALTADRCYHKGRQPADALKFLLNGAGSHFNPSLVKKFVHSIGIYPVGCLVLLSNDYLAKVIEIKGNMLKPTVEVVINIKTRSYVPRKIIDLNLQSDITIKSAESYEKWHIKPDI